jgi:nucleotide-binding universal stress UspA family protein
VGGTAGRASPEQNCTPSRRWHLPTTYGWIPSVADFDWAGNARRTLDGAIKDSLDDTRAGSIRRDVVDGHPAAALLHAAADADLLVVGSRGRGELAACCSARSLST